MDILQGPKLCLPQFRLQALQVRAAPPPGNIRPWQGPIASIAAAASSAVVGRSERVSFPMSDLEIHHVGSFRSLLPLRPPAVSEPPFGLQLRFEFVDLHVGQRAVVQSRLAQGSPSQPA